VPVLTYGGIHYGSNRDELDPFDDFAMPTTQSFRPLYHTIVTSTWVDMGTGEELPDYDPTANPVRHAGGGMLPGGMSMVTVRETPTRRTFTLLLHTLLSVLLGFAGARFAVYVHAREESG